MANIGEIIDPSDIEYPGTQPILDTRIIGPEAQVILNVLKGVEETKQGLVLPTEHEKRIEWAEKAYAGTVTGVSILMALGEVGIFPKKL